MKKPWFLKGTTGEVLRDMKAEGEGPFTVEARQEFPGVPMICAQGAGGHDPFNFAFSIRGNSKQRRQQRRQLERWLNEARTICE